MFLKDSDGGDHADIRVRVLDGMDSADTHHTANSFSIDPGGAIYWQEGTFMHTQVETPYGPPIRNANAGVYRYEPRTQKFDVVRHLRLRQPARPRLGPLGRGRTSTTAPGPIPITERCSPAICDFPEKHPHPPQVYNQRTRPCPGIEILSSRAFPPENQGNLLVRQRHRLPGHPPVQAGGDGRQPRRPRRPSRSSPRPIRISAPSDLKIGPDGAIYFLDWQNPIIGHMQHNLRDPNRDRTHGRIYRDHLRRPAAAQAGEDRRRADRETARSAQGAGGPRPLAGPRSSWAAATATT